MVGTRLLHKIPYAYERAHGIRGRTTLWAENRTDILNFVRPNGIGIELGVADAIFSKQLLDRGLLRRLYGVDRYLGDRAHDDRQYQAALDRTRPFGDIYTLLRMTFDEALAEF